MRLFVGRFCADDCGTTAIEYALIGGLVALAIVGSLGNLGGGVGALYRAFELISDALSGVI